MQSNVSFATQKYSLTVKIDSGIIQYYTPTMIKNSDVPKLCKDGATTNGWPFGEKISVVNERGIILGVGVINKRLTPKLLRHWPNDPTKQYSVQYEDLNEQFNSGQISEQELNQKWSEYTKDKFIADISCPMQAVFNIYPSGNFFQIRIDRFNQMDLTEISKLKKANWKYTVSMEYEG